MGTAVGRVEATQPLAAAVAQQRQVHTRCGCAWGGCLASRGGNVGGAVAVRSPWSAAGWQ